MSKVEKGDRGARVGSPTKMKPARAVPLAADRGRETSTSIVRCLRAGGVDTQFRKGRLYVTDTDNSKYSFSLAKLDADLNANGLEDRFLQNVEADIEAKARKSPRPVQPSRPSASASPASAMPT